MKKEILFAVIIIFSIILSISCEDESTDPDNQMVDPYLPNGFEGTTILLNKDTTYTVPSGKSLYFTAGSTSPNDCFISTDQKKYYIDGRGVIPENTTITVSGECFFSCLLSVENYEVVNWYTAEDYVVPDGKKLVLLSVRNEPPAFSVNNIAVNVASMSEYMLVLPGGSELTWNSENSFNNLDYIFTGYLMVE